MTLYYSKEVGNAELCEIDELYDRLIYKILMGIDNEIALLSDISTRFNNVNQVNKFFFKRIYSFCTR